MVDRGRAQDMNEAAARFADTLAESYRIVYAQAAETRERQEKFAREFSERVLANLREQAESGRAASEQLAEQSRRQQQAGRELAQESLHAYMEFLDAAFSQYRSGTQQATGLAREEVRTVSETTAGLVDTATDATREAAESVAGQPPIVGYDEMNVAEIEAQLDDLAETELVRVRDYERRNKNRQSLLAQIERRLETSS